MNAGHVLVCVLSPELSWLRHSRGDAAGNGSLAGPWQHSLARSARRQPGPRRTGGAGRDGAVPLVIPGCSILLQQGLHGLFFFLKALMLLFFFFNY